MITVRQLMQEKAGAQTYAVSPQATTHDALQLMAEANIGAVMVVDEQGQMIGIFTERDYVRKVVLKGKASLEAPVSEFMTSRMVTVNLETTLEECMDLMSQFRIRHLPVMHDERQVGMISMRDVVEAILSKKQSTIENLENYILGKEYIR